MAFSTAAFLETITPPVFTHRGRSWTGVFISIDQWLTYTPRIDAVVRGTATAGEARQLYVELCDLMFPPTLLQRLTRSTVAKVLMRLPPSVQGQAMQDFCDSQLTALGLKPSNRENTPRPMTTTTKP